MELQAFPRKWEKLFPCKAHRTKNHQTVRGQQGQRVKMRRFPCSVYLGIATAILLGTIKGLFVFTTATRCKRFLDRDQITIGYGFRVENNRAG